MLLVERLNNGQIDLLALASISQPEFPLERALGLNVGSNMFFIYIYIYSTVCGPDRVEEPKRDKLTEGRLPLLVSTVKGSGLLSSDYWLLFMEIYSYHCNAFFWTRIRESSQGWRG